MWTQDFLSDGSHAAEPRLRQCLPTPKHSCIEIVKPNTIYLSFLTHNCCMLVTKTKQTDSGKTPGSTAAVANCSVGRGLIQFT